MRSVLGATLIVVVVTAGLSACTTPAGPVPSSAPSASSSAESFSLQQYKDQRWQPVAAQFPDAVRPSVDVERYVSPDEWPEVWAECMSDQGFDATASNTGGVSGNVPAGQEEPAAIARYTCDVRFPTDPKYTAPLNDGQLDLLYTYFTDTLTPCLEKEGYQIQSAPSLARFKETYYSTSSWTPYKDVIDALGDRPFDDVDAICPQLPDNLYQ